MRGPPPKGTNFQCAGRFPISRVGIFSVAAPVVWITVHEVAVAIHDGAFWDEDRGGAGRVADGEGRIIKGNANCLQGDGT